MITITKRLYFPYNEELKKFGKEWNGGGSSDVEWVDTPEGCTDITKQVLDWEEYVKENSVGVELIQARLIPRCRVAASESARKNMRKCVAKAVDITYTFNED